jgi:hypothetical protein
MPDDKTVVSEGEDALVCAGCGHESGDGDTCVDMNCRCWCPNRGLIKKARYGKDRAFNPYPSSTPPEGYY